MISAEMVMRPAIIRRTSTCQCGWSETIEYEGGSLVAESTCPNCSVADLADKLVLELRRRGNVREGFMRVLEAL